MSEVRWGKEAHSLRCLFSSLGQNTSLKTLSLVGPLSVDKSLFTAMQSGLGRNETLESMESNQALLGEDNTELWSRAFSSLRSNRALKCLVITLESSVSAFRIYIAAVLQGNASLESLSILNWNFPYKSKGEGEEYSTFTTALHQNQALKTLTLNPDWSIMLHDVDQQMASLLKKNYALQILAKCVWAGDVVAILRLNAVGRRYLIEGKRSSISKGVDVLSRVNNHINCMFLHLLENPTLCDRSAMKLASKSKSNSTRSTYPSASTVVVKKSGSKPAHTKARSPAGDSSSLYSTSAEDMGDVSRVRSII
jgi:hypothetical protein